MMSEDDNTPLGCSHGLIAAVTGIVFLGAVFISVTFPKTSLIMGIIAVIAVIVFIYNCVG